MALWDRIKESAQTMQAQLEAKKNDLKIGAPGAPGADGLKGPPDRKQS